MRMRAETVRFPKLFVSRLPVSFRCPGPRVIAVAVAATAFVAAFDGRALAETRLEARYTATLAGMPIGRGAWQVDVAEDQYTAVASGKTSGLLSVFNGGHGTAASRGGIKGGALQALRFGSSVI